jgi:hypothetical protein
MAGLFSRLKIWNPGEDLTAADLNGEFNQFLSNIDAEHSEGYSANLSEMQTEVNPGGLGSENLLQPISVADEIKRLRYVISRITGKGYWYETPAQDLQSINTAIDSIFNLTPSRINSGLSTSLSKFPVFLQAAGASGVKINASISNPFNCAIDSAVLNLTADLTSGLLSFAPLSNTATLASSFSGDQASQEATEFTISSAGASIIGNIGRQAIFKINNGSDDEFFLGTIESTTSIIGIRRGYFRNTSNAAVPPVTLTTGHTITMLRTTWVFLRNDSTIQVSYNPPQTNGPAPVSASAGDYWFDRANNTWKVYTTTWVVANAIYIGMCAQDTSVTVCARSEKFFKNYNETNEIYIDSVTNTVISSRKDIPTEVSVNGLIVENKFQNWSWDMTSDMYPGEIEGASLRYYFYLDQNGKKYITRVSPVFELDLRAYYHPYERLRCIASVYNNLSSNLVAPIQQYLEKTTEDPSPIPSGSVLAFGGTTAPSGFLLCNGDSYLTASFRDLFAAIGYAHGGSAANFNVPDYRGRFLRGVDGGTGRDPDAASRTVMNTGGNTGNAVGSLQTDGFKSHQHDYTYRNNNHTFEDEPGPSAWEGTSTQSTGATGGNETRPVNAYVNYIIKT